MEIIGPFWAEWSIDKSCTLNDEDIYILTVLKKNDFDLEPEELLMFYHKAKIITTLTFKLALKEKEFRLWLVKKWQITLCDIALRGDFDSFFSSDIMKLNLKEEALEILQGFGQKSIRKILLKNSEDNFCQDNNFQKIWLFLTRLEASNLKKTRLSARKVCSN